LVEAEAKGRWQQTPPLAEPLIDFQYHFLMTALQIANMGDANNFCPEQFGFGDFSENTAKAHFLCPPFYPQNPISTEYVRKSSPNL